MRYLFLAALLPWLCCACTDREEENLQQAMDTFERVDFLLDKVGKDDYQMTIKILRDDIKRKYQPIGPVMDTILLATKELLSAIGVCDFALRHEKDFSREKQLEHFATLEKILTATNTRIERSYYQFMEEYGDSISLKKEDAVKYTQWLSDHTLVPKTFWQNSHYTKFTDRDLRFLLAKMKTDVKQRAAFLIYHFAELSGGMNDCGYFYSLPEIIQQQNKMVRGRSFKAIIGFPGLCYEHSRFNLHIYVNDKELSSAKGRFAYYTSAPIYQDEKTIYITGKLKDPVTGEIQVLIEDFPYSIIVD